MADYSRVDISDPTITKLLDDYFDVLYFQGMDLFVTVFHQDCVLALANAQLELSAAWCRTT